MILYQDAIAHALMLTRRDLNGNWLCLTLRSPLTQQGDDAAGFYARGIRKDQEIWVSHYVYQNQLDPPRTFVEFFKTPTP